MKFKQGADVFTSSGEKAGSIANIVIDPSTTEVTHLIIQKGFIFKEDKIVPVDFIDEAAEDHVVLKDDIESYDLFPRYQEAHFESFPQETNGEKKPEWVYPDPLYWYPPIGTAGEYLGYPPFWGIPENAPQKIVVENLPEDTVTLDKNLPVMSSDGQQVGQIEEVFADAENNKVSHILISQGGILEKEQKLLPAAWINEVTEDEMWLKVDARFLSRIAEFEG